MRVHLCTQACTTVVRLGMHPQCAYREVEAQLRCRVQREDLVPCWVSGACCAEGAPAAPVVHFEGGCLCVLCTGSVVGEAAETCKVYSVHVREVGELQVQVVAWLRRVAAAPRLTHSGQQAQVCRRRRRRACRRHLALPTQGHSIKQTPIFPPHPRVPLYSVTQRPTHHSTRGHTPLTQISHPPTQRNSCAHRHNGDHFTTKKSPRKRGKNRSCCVSKAEQKMKKTAEKVCMFFLSFLLIDRKPHFGSKLHHHFPQTTAPAPRRRINKRIIFS